MRVVPWGRAYQTAALPGQPGRNLSWQPWGGYGEHSSEERRAGHLRGRTGARGKEGRGATHECVLGEVLRRGVGQLARVAQSTVKGELTWSLLGLLVVSASRARLCAVVAPPGPGTSVM